MGRTEADPAIPDPWRPRKDAVTYVLSALVLVLELPILAVLVLAAVVTRTAARAAAVAAGLLRLSRREKIAT
jgi:hypothetical protein